MKYIDAERLKVVIERRIEETKSMKPSFDQFWAGQISAFKGCLSIITSLQQEQPEVNEDEPHWKPSEEQMNALEYFIRSWGESGTMSPQNPTLCAAKTLLNDLKSL